MSTLTTTSKLVVQSDTSSSISFLTFATSAPHHEGWCWLKAQCVAVSLFMRTHTTPKLVTESNRPTCTNVKVKKKKKELANGSGCTGCVLRTGTHNTDFVQPQREYKCTTYIPQCYWLPYRLWSTVISIFLPPFRMPSFLSCTEFCPSITTTVSISSSTVSQNRGLIRQNKHKTRMHQNENGQKFQIM